MQVIVATKNKGKLREFSRILSPLDITVIGLADLSLDVEIEETGSTFAENAQIKAETIHAITGRAVVSDDSGLCVDALDGRPGVYSARYGGEELPYPEKIAMLLGELEGVPAAQRTASFQRDICFVAEDSSVYHFAGSCPGVIGYEPRGENGFGYDPIFYVGEQSFSELSDREKDECSHRGKALRAFAASLPKILRR